MEWIDLKTVFIIAHVFGAIIGVGGAYMSDVMFFATIFDQKIEKTEFRFMKIGNVMIWVGLLILMVTGALIFFLDPGTYAQSTKFLAKITIVTLIFVNGVIFHILHLPRMKRHRDMKFSQSKEFMKWLPALAASGGASITSWTIVVILGMLKTVPYSYWQIMSVYIGLVVIAAVSAVFVLQYMGKRKLD